MILFRCDANPRLGFGHLMRCRALAAALSAQGETCMMVGPAASCQQAVDARTFRHWQALPWLDNPASDAAELADIAVRYGASAVVLDDPRIDESYQQILRAAGLRWLQFDGGRHLPVWADLIVNANPAASQSYYREYAMNAEATLLLGPAHAVLRPEFQFTAPPRISATSKHVLLMFGGGDDRGAIRFAINALHAALPEDMIFNIVAGRDNPYHDVHRALLATLPAGRARYHINPPALPLLMQDSALAVMAGGTTTYEANLFGLPMVLIAIADNQIAQSQAWAAQGQAIYVGELDALDPQHLVQASLELLKRQVRPPRMVDGLGATRVATALISALSAAECRNRHALA